MILSTTFEFFPSHARDCVSVKSITHLSENLRDSSVLAMSVFNSFLISVFFLVFSSPSAISESSELSILMAIKASLDPQNTLLTSWSPSSNPCGGYFEGVACNEQGKVVNISLQGMGLSGYIPAAVAGLKSLTGLYLHFNALIGEIPKEIASLTELTDLYLNVNQLSGEIPFEIGNMVNLQGEFK